MRLFTDAGREAVHKTCESLSSQRNCQYIMDFEIVTANYIIIRCHSEPQLHCLEEIL